MCRTCSSYDGYGFSQRCVGTEKELVQNPLEAKARKLDNQARSVQNAHNVSCMECPGGCVGRREGVRWAGEKDVRTRGSAVYVGSSREGRGNKDFGCFYHTLH